MADAIIREYYDAAHAYKVRYAEELTALEHIRDKDVRTAKAELAIPREMHDRLLAATIALDEKDAEREERWIAAHEDLAILRRGGRVS